MHSHYVRTLLVRAQFNFDFPWMGFSLPIVSPRRRVAPLLRRLRIFWSDAQEAHQAFYVSPAYDQWQHHLNGRSSVEERRSRIDSHGYIEQAFTRVCVRESLQHGEEDVPFQLREDVRRTLKGHATLSRKVETDSPIPIMQSVYEAAAKLRAKESGSTST